MTLGPVLDLTPLATRTRRTGIGRYLRELAGGFAAVGAELRGLKSLTWAGEASLESNLVEACAELAALPPTRREAWSYRTRLALAPALRRAGASLIHSAHPEATPLGRLPCPRVLTCHDLIPWRWPQRYAGWRDGFGRGRRWLDRRRYHRADHLIAVSRATADDLMRRIDVPARRISVVHNGVDLEFWTPGTGTGGPAYLLMVGAADWRKNHVAAVAALARARREVPELRLLVAGYLSPRRSRELQQMSRQLRVAVSVESLGWIDDRQLRRLYRGALALLFPSRMEGFGYPLVEAMACGCPIIAANIPSTAEVTGEAALLRDAEDHRDIAHAITELAGDGEMRTQLAAAGRLRSRELSRERMAERTWAAYRLAAAR